jgi:hypothetical protein
MSVSFGDGSDPLRVHWEEFLSKKDQSLAWQKMLLKMLAMENLPEDLRLEIGKVVMVETPNMPYGLRSDAYCLVTWHVTELSAQAWTKAQEIGLTKADLQLCMVTYPIKTAITRDDVKSLVSKARNTITTVARSFGKKVDAALETSPYHDLYEKMKKMTL